ncbi:MAG: EFR1 family ferrodoxin [Candidatus Heimdallarchaeaceae archaeon]
MKGIVCYYSNTGNTKLACHYLANKIKNANFDLFNIAEDGIPELDKYNVIGFATYAEFWGPPYLFQEFIERLPEQHSKPAFIFNTYGCISGKTLRMLKTWVSTKGFSVIAGHSLHTPENYPPMIAAGRGYEQAPNEKEIAKFNTFISILDRNLHLLQQGKTIKKSRIKIGLLNSFLLPFSRTKARKAMGAKFVDDTLCTECGICEKVCPHGAIHLDPKPIFNMNKCYGCWSCYNRCPTKAIYTKKYRGVGHYPAPNTQLKEKLKVK